MSAIQLSETAQTASAVAFLHLTDVVGAYEAANTERRTRRPGQHPSDARCGEPQRLLRAAERAAYSKQTCTAMLISCYRVAQCALLVHRLPQSSCQAVRCTG